jgi:prepilin-type N-terminal cleavage/methylation domain-containing protein
MRDDRGFTLIELMVAILIARILAAIATPISLGAVDQARSASVQAELASARLDLAESWAASRSSAPVRGGECAADATIVLP